MQHDIARLRVALAVHDEPSRVARQPRQVPILVVYEVHDHRRESCHVLPSDRAKSLTSIPATMRAKPVEADGAVLKTRSDRVTTEPAIENQPYQLLPPLSDDEYRALKADIAVHGVLVAVEVDDQGHIIDGHHRVQAWQELRGDDLNDIALTREGERHLATSPPRSALSRVFPWRGDVSDVRDVCRETFSILSLSYPGVPRLSHL